MKKKDTLTGQDQPELQKGNLFKNTLRKMCYIAIIDQLHPTICGSAYKILNPLCLPENCFF